MNMVLASEAASLASETLLVLAVVVIAGPLLAEKARLPGLIGFMVGGTVFGPYVLGVLDEGQFDGIGSLGILYLMFLAGLELDMDIFNRYRKAAGQFGLLTFAVPFGLGWWVGLQIDLPLPSAILLGSIWASHTLVSLPIVKRAGLSGSRSVAVAAGATIITDTLALLVLAIISSGAAGDAGVGTVVRLVVGLAVLIFVTVWLLPNVGNWFFKGPGQERALRFVFLLGSMALGGLIAEWGGMEGIVGAFFAGLGLNRLVPKRSKLMDRVEFLGSSLFIPAFLISVGMLIDPGLLFDVSTLTLAGLFIAVVLTGKGLAAVGGRPLFKFSWSEVGLLFSLTIGQAAATLAAALVGVSLGLFDGQVLNAVVLAVLVTVMVASILTKLFSGLVEPERTLLLPLGSSVVVPVDTSTNTEMALQVAGHIARADSGLVSPVVVVPVQHASREKTEEAQTRVDEAESTASTSGAEAEGVIRVASSVESAVLGVVAERIGSAIVLQAPAGRRLVESVFGGPVQSIGAASPVPTILVARPVTDPQRLVLVVPGTPRTPGDQVDLQVSLDVVEVLASALSLPVSAVIGSGAQVPKLPDGSSITELDATDPARILAFLQQGDLVVSPLSSTRRYVARVTRGVTDGSNIGVIVTAGPHRLARAGLASEEVGAVLGYGGSVT